MAYATVTDLEETLGNGYTPPNAQRLLDRASRDVDRAIQCATYATDTNDLPTDPVVLTALKEATLEQVAYNAEIGNTNGIIHAMQSGVPSGTSAGSIDLSRGPSAGGSTDGLPWLGPQAGWVLRQAGLLGQPPYTWIGLL
jgi:hypothetical protein